jgi:hypothetical protein
LLTRYRYEGQPSAQETAVWFWYVPIWFIGFVSLLGVLIVIFVVFARRHNLVRRLRTAIVQARRKKSVRVIPAVPIVHDKKESALRRPKPVLDVAGPRRSIDVQKPLTARNDTQTAVPKLSRVRVKTSVVSEEDDNQQESEIDIKEPLDIAPEIKPKNQRENVQIPLENKSE